MFIACGIGHLLKAMTDCHRICQSFITSNVATERSSCSYRLRSVGLLALSTLIPLIMARVVLTFEGIRSPGCCVLVRVQLQSQFPVCLLQVILTHILCHTKDGVEVLSLKHSVSIAREGRGRVEGF